MSSTGPARGQGDTPDTRELQLATELVVLRRAVDAARLETRAALRQADAAKREARDAAKAEREVADERSRANVLVPRHSKLSWNIRPCGGRYIPESDHLGRLLWTEG